MQSYSNASFLSGIHTTIRKWWEWRIHPLKSSGMFLYVNICKCLRTIHANTEVEMLYYIGFLWFLFVKLWKPIHLFTLIWETFSDMLFHACYPTTWEVDIRMIMVWGQSQKQNAGWGDVHLRSQLRGRMWRIMDWVWPQSKTRDPIWEIKEKSWCVAQAVEHPSSITGLGSNPVPHPQRGKNKKKYLKNAW
jgi:hypothetical protein